MKQKDQTDLKNKTITELDKVALELQLQITKAQMEAKMHKNKNTNLAKNLKKELAQVLTIRNKHANS